MSQGLASECDSSTIFWRVESGNYWSTVISKLSKHYTPAEYLGDTAVGDLEDARDVARPRPRVRQLHDLLAGRVG